MLRAALRLGQARELHGSPSCFAGRGGRAGGAGRGGAGRVGLAGWLEDGEQGLFCLRTETNARARSESSSDAL